MARSVTLACSRCDTRGCPDCDYRGWVDEVQPEPMPGRLPDGTRVWLHYRPLRWERTP